MYLQPVSALKVYTASQFVFLKATAEQCISHNLTMILSNYTEQTYTLVTIIYCVSYISVCVCVCVCVCVFHSVAPHKVSVYLAHAEQLITRVGKDNLTLLLHRFYNRHSLCFLYQCGLLGVVPRPPRFFVVVVLPFSVIHTATPCIILNAE